jgi:hypothetical protein
MEGLNWVELIAGGVVSLVAAFGGAYFAFKLERLGQARLLLRLRLTDGVLLRGGSRRLDQRRIPRPSRGLADDGECIAGAIHACVYRHEDPMVRDQRRSSAARVGRAVRGGQVLRRQNFAITLVGWKWAAQVMVPAGRRLG